MVATGFQLSEGLGLVLSAIMLKAMTSSAFALNKAPWVLGVERCLAARLTTALKEHFVCTPNTHYTCSCCGNSPVLSYTWFNKTGSSKWAFLGFKGAIMEMYIDTLSLPGIFPELDWARETLGKRILPYCEPSSLGKAQISTHLMQNHKLPQLSVPLLQLRDLLNDDCLSRKSLKGK